MLGLFEITAIRTIWGHSSAGRAPAWHAGVSGSNPLGSIYLLVFLNFIIN